MATLTATREARVALSLVLGLPSLCSFAQAAVSAVWHALSAFDPTFPFLFLVFVSFVF